MVSDNNIPFFFQEMLFIFDVNGVLCKSTKKSQAILRPGLRELFDAISQEIDIDFAFWTSKMIHNGEPLLKKILHESGHPEMFEKALFRWYSTECTKAPTSADPYAIIKDLSRVWKTFPQYSQENTLLLDDDQYKAGIYANSNLLLVPAFMGDKDDQVLLDITLKIQKIQRTKVICSEDHDFQIL